MTSLRAEKMEAAAKKGDSEIMGRLAAEGAVPGDALQAAMRCVIMEDLRGMGQGDPRRAASVASGRLACLRLLLGAGMDPNVSNEVGWSLALCAAHQGNLEALRLLIHAGAKPESLVHGSPTHALDVAMLQNQPGVVRELWGMGACAGMGPARLAEALACAASLGTAESALALFDLAGPDAVGELDAFFELHSTPSQEWRELVAARVAVLREREQIGAGAAEPKSGPRSGIGRPRV